MPSRAAGHSFFLATLLAFGSSAALAQPATSRESSTRDPRTPAQRAAKGPLPDPALLDGSTLEAEKRPENGMLGEFEMAGDENAKGDRVGKSGEQPAQQGGGGGQQAAADQSKSGGGGSSGAAGGGGGPESPQQAAAQGGGGGGAPSDNQSQAQKGGASGNSSSQGGNGGAAEGTQVGQMNGAGGQSGQNGPPSPNKPQQVALGDSAMQIKSPGGAAPGVVGAQQLPQGKDVPQAYDAKTPSGGKQSGGGRGNQGVEKGRVMPAGI